ncbi:hypothetical protein DNH61_04815 [Paenibacillus sambharensis]|uniref:Uncharacterized protein n=1 Tax=Paenibacillus sambharensis TaxID=1803190 RepID=A0A2W1LPW5_9BACL|nr:hypothetical protein [Paenibacillus sambharensis]PZD96972.1 hypothetical protein DNH61_04815 [Paenibacillus sambharensis]
MKNFIYIIIIMGPAMYFGFTGRPTEMGISVVASALAITFINMDKFEFFKGAGFEAQLKKVEKATEEAYATIDALKTVAAPIIAETLHSISHAMRYSAGVAEIQRKLDAKYELDRVAESLGLKYEPLQKEQADFYRLHTWDLYSWVVGYFSKLKVDSKEIQLLFDVRSEYINTVNYPSRERILELLGSEYSKIDEEGLERIEDYLYFSKNKKLRRPITEEE